MSLDLGGSAETEKSRSDKSGSETSVVSGTQTTSKQLDTDTLQSPPGRPARNCFAERLRVGSRGSEQD